MGASGKRAAIFAILLSQTFRIHALAGENTNIPAIKPLWIRKTVILKKACGNINLRLLLERT